MKKVSREVRPKNGKEFLQLFRPRVEFRLPFEQEENSIMVEQVEQIEYSWVKALKRRANGLFEVDDSALRLLYLRGQGSKKWVFGGENGIKPSPPSPPPPPTSSWKGVPWLRDLFTRAESEFNPQERKEKKSFPVHVHACSRIRPSPFTLP